MMFYEHGVGVLGLERWAEVPAEQLRGLGC